MNEHGYIQVHGLSRGEAPPPLVNLVLRVIWQAQQDIMKGRTKANRCNYDSAVHFFKSELYLLMLDYVGCYFPEVGGMPAGVRV